MGHVAWNKGLKDVVKLSEETKKKISKNSAKYWFGKKLSEETKKKIGLSHSKIKGIKYKININTKKYKNKIRINNEKEIRITKQRKRNELKNYIRNLFQYRQWRSDIFTRDNFTCKECYKNKCYVEAHHIKPLSKILTEYNIKNIKDALSCIELWNLNNGIILCKECHNKIPKK